MYFIDCNSNPNAFLMPISIYNVSPRVEPFDHKTIRHTKYSNTYYIENESLMNTDMYIAYIQTK